MIRPMRKGAFMDLPPRDWMAETLWVVSSANQIRGPRCRSDNRVFTRGQGNEREKGPTTLVITLVHSSVHVGSKPRQNVFVDSPQALDV